MKPSQLLTVTLALAPLASAWPGWLPEADSLVVRQDDNGGDNTAEPTPTDEDSPKATPTDESNDEATPTKDEDKKTTEPPETTNLNTGGRTTDTAKETGSQTGKDKDKGSKTTATKHKTFPAEDGAGGVAMVTPALTDGSQLYKIEAPTPITWAWNYTSVQGTPTAIDVLVSCSVASATWTLTQNMTYSPQATFKWDTAAYQRKAVDKRLLTEQYTLIIYDADGSPTDTAEAGYLAPFDGFTFGLYAKQPYQNLSEWECVTCSAAPGDFDRGALGFALSMSVITVLSFTWYVVGFAGLL